jgi:hypothetical protein
MASEPRFIVIIGATMPGPGHGLVGSLDSQSNREGTWVDLVRACPSKYPDYEKGGGLHTQFERDLRLICDVPRDLTAVKLRHETLVGTIDEIVEWFRRCLVDAAEKHCESPFFEETQKAIEAAGIDSLRIIDPIRV